MIFHHFLSLYIYSLANLLESVNVIDIIIIPITMFYFQAFTVFRIIHRATDKTRYLPQEKETLQLRDGLTSRVGHAITDPLIAARGAAFN